MLPDNAESTRSDRSHRRLRRAIVALVALLILACSASPAEAQSDGAGGVRGSVDDADFGAPLAGVRISLVELGLRTATDDDGNYVFEQVPPGSYTVTFAKDGYERVVRSGIVVTPGRMADVAIEMTIQVVDLPEMVVTGSDFLAGSEMAMLEIRGDALNLQDNISSEIFGKAGVSDVAGALKLVVGASISEGKYATVRGLSDRYTGTTLNGLRVPSADPRRRAVQVDVFPTGTIESISVTKTFTPDLQGDFTGGGVDIITKSMPDHPIFSVSISEERDELASNNDAFLSYRGGGVKTLGFAGKERDLPAVAREPLPTSSPPTANYPFLPVTPEQLAKAQAWDRLVRAFQPAMGVSRTTAPLNKSVSIVGGTRYDIGRNQKLGFIGAVSWSNKYSFYELGTNDSVEFGPGGLAQTQRSDSRGTEEVLLGVLGDVVWQPGEDSELSLKLVLNQSAQDEARFQLGSGAGLPQQNQSLTYTERTVGAVQLIGHHDFRSLFGGPFSDLRLSGGLSLTSTRQFEPDRRLFRNSYDPRTLKATIPPNSTDASNSRRTFREIQESGWIGKLDVRLPFVQWAQAEGSVRAGIYHEQTDRDFSEDAFTYKFPTQNCFSGAACVSNRLLSGYTGTGPDDLWTDVFHSPDRIGLASNADDPGIGDNQLLWVLAPLVDEAIDYTGEQRIDAAYAMAELPLTRRLTTILGARFERTELGIVPMTNNPDGKVYFIFEEPLSGRRFLNRRPAEESIATIDESSVLPSIGLVYEVLPSMNVRATWSRTIARPTFRELSPVATADFLEGDNFVGNPDLTLTDVTNWDLRWEWFRRQGEVYAASLFTKDLTEPIEYLSFGASNRTFIQPQNFGTGSLEGIELEVRLPLGGLWRPLEGLTVGSNFTRLNSSVDLPEVEKLGLGELAQDARRLQGQPANLFNANVSYDNDHWGTSLSVFYNRVGETLLTGAARGESGQTPSVIDLPNETLDLTASQRLFRSGTGTLTLALKARNLTQDDVDTAFRIPSGQERIKTLHASATRYSVGLEYAW